MLNYSCPQKRRNLPPKKEHTLKCGCDEILKSNFKYFRFWRCLQTERQLEAEGGQLSKQQLERFREPKPERNFRHLGGADERREQRSQLAAADQDDVVDDKLVELGHGEASSATFVSARN